jgi:hypothetical protein
MPVTGIELKRVADAISAGKKDMTLTIRGNKNGINQIKKMAQKRKIL